jgi:hypothetical protein
MLVGSQGIGYPTPLDDRDFENHFMEYTAVYPIISSNNPLPVAFDTFKSNSTPHPLGSLSHDATAGRFKGSEQGKHPAGSSAGNELNQLFARMSMPQNNDRQCTNVQASPPREKGTTPITQLKQISVSGLFASAKRNDSGLVMSTLIKAERAVAFENSLNVQNPSSHVPQTPSEGPQLDKGSALLSILQPHKRLPL